RREKRSKTRKNRLGFPSLFGWSLILPPPRLLGGFFKEKLYLGVHAPELVLGPFLQHPVKPWVKP
ncbi:hypothetical protein ABTA75_19015, partial [Acinetobacter baumannii]